MVISVYFGAYRIDYNSFEEIFSLENKLLISELDCSHNFLTKLPRELGSLVGLKVLDCSNNKLTELPRELGSLVNLEKLECSSNKLTELPKEIYNLVNLELLFCDENRLTKFSSEISNLVKLRELSCNKNELTELPNSLGSLVNLACFRCIKNELTELPKEIGNLKSLYYLDVTKNELTNLPLEIIKCSYLEVIRFDYIEHNFHPLVRKFIRRLPCHDNTYSANSLVITESITESIFNILKDPLEIDVKKMIKEIKENTFLTNKAVINKWLSNSTVHFNLGITFKDFMLYFWNRIRQSKDFNDICERINRELVNHKEKSFTWRFVILLGQLNIRDLEIVYNKDEGDVDKFDEEEGDREEVDEEEGDEEEGDEEEGDEEEGDEEEGDEEEGDEED